MNPLTAAHDPFPEPVATATDACGNKMSILPLMPQRPPSADLPLAPNVSVGTTTGNPPLNFADVAKAESEMEAVNSFPGEEDDIVFVISPDMDGGVQHRRRRIQWRRDWMVGLDGDLAKSHERITAALNRVAECLDPANLIELHATAKRSHCHIDTLISEETLERGLSDLLGNIAHALGEDLVGRVSIVPIPPKKPDDPPWSVPSPIL